MNALFAAIRTAASANLSDFGFDGPTPRSKRTPVPLSVVAPYPTLETPTIGRLL